MTTGRQRPWPEFSLQHEIFAPMMRPARTQFDHVVELNLGDPLSFSWEMNGNWNHAICKTGGIVSLASPGEVGDMQWSGSFDSLRISISPSFVDHLLGTEKFSFATTRNAEDLFLKDLCCNLLNEREKTDGQQSIYQDSLIVALVIHLVSTYPADKKKIFAPKGKLSSNQLRNVIEFTRESIHKNIRLSELADAVHLSEFHFARLFRQTVGLSPYKFVLEMKIDCAKDLIRHHKKSFSDIAYLLNFSDQAHFSHVFKKLTGASPRHFSNAVAC
jgi:AraC family transcriptional regulator